ncbi:glycerate kinase [Anopheles gambiae]|uniref:glycerate kinase n=1 Tax=Anopheles gambiae TaxID=7165 RepID=UPI002AC91C00|nr:glycerate kinase [Anopheles gambiae]
MIRSWPQFARKMSTANSASLTNLRELFLCGVEAVKPKSLFDGCHMSAGSIRESFLHDHKRYHVVGFGKAVLGMAVQLECHLGSRLSGGCISIPTGTGERFAGEAEFTLSPSTAIEVIECARNNLPDEGSLMAAKKIKQIAHSMTSDDVLCVLVSGGGSALLCLPKELITLEEKLQLIKSLATAGASIDELNNVRIALSEVKGGQLALAAEHAYRVYSYVISDIVGDPVALIASGPTVVQKGVAVNGKAKEILEKYGLWSKLPDSILKVIEQPTVREVKETYNNDLFLLGNNEVAVNCIVQQAQARDWECIVLSKRIEGNVIDLAPVYIQLAAILYNLKTNFISETIAKEKLRELLTPLPYSDVKMEEFISQAVEGNKEKPLLIVGAGEPTVCVSGGGKGGRNQELALRFTVGVRELERVPDAVCFLSAGTDGIDGPTDVAGAIGGAFVAREFEETFHLAEAKSFLEQNDSYRFYEAVSGGQYFVKTGHTGTNVMDVHLLLINPQWVK